MQEQKQLWLEFSCMVLANQNWDGDTIICTQEHLAPIIYKFGIMGVIPERLHHKIYNILYLGIPLQQLTRLVIFKATDKAKCIA